MTSQFANEMDEEVMDAIAIAARTNAYYLVSRKMEAPWHVDAQEVGYQGYAVTLQNLHVDRAVNNTRHMVLTYQANLSRLLGQKTAQEKQLILRPFTVKMS